MKKNILGVFALSLLVLMGTGVAFGHWTDWIYINGYVNTGTMDVVPSYEGSTFDSFNYKQYNNFTGVAYDDVRVDLATSTIYINLYNVYPAVCWYGTFNIENIGTVPAGFVNMSMTAPGLRLEQVGSNWEWNVFYTDVGQPEIGPIAVLYVAPGANDTGPSNLCQIDPGDPVYFDVRVCFKNPLPQDTIFTFALTLEFWNWNEAPCPLLD